MRLTVRIPCQSGRMSIPSDGFKKPVTFGIITVGENVHAQWLANDIMLEIELDDEKLREVLNETG